MKTLRKAIWGIMFLAPLLLPSQTKAGPFDNWLHSIFDNQRTPDIRRNPDFNRGVAGESGYRPYDPWTDRNAPHAPAGQPGEPNAVPIDGGLVFLFAAGLGLGLWKMYEYRRRSGATMV